MGIPWEAGEQGIRSPEMIEQQRRQDEAFVDTQMRKEMADKAQPRTFRCKDCHYEWTVNAFEIVVQCPKCRSLSIEQI